MRSNAGELGRTLGLTITVLGVIALPPATARSQTIIEIIDSTGDAAGNGLDFPRGVAVDGSGNVYVTGQHSDNAFKIDPNGVITEIIDSSGDGAGNALEDPIGVAVDGLGNVYVTGVSSDNAFKIDPNGVVTEIIDSSGDGAGNALEGPFGIAVDESGIFITGIPSDNAFKIDPNGVITEIIDSSGDGAGNLLARPRFIALDELGNAYITSLDGVRGAFRIDPNGSITKIIDGLVGPWGIAVDGSRNVYVADTNSPSASVYRIDPNGVVTEIIESSGDGAGNELDGPYAIAVDGSGNVYVSGNGSDNAFQIFPGGAIVQIIDAAGDGAGNPLNHAEGIAVDDSRNVYVVGLHSRNVFRVEVRSCGDGMLDIDEECDDGNINSGDGCTTACTICGNGVVTPPEQCDDGNNDDEDGCSASCTIAVDCTPAPLVGCLTPGGSGKAQLQVKDQSPAGPGPKDKVQWKWLKGPALTQTDFGNPTDPNGPDYKLCIYTGSTPAVTVELNVPAGGTCSGKPCWKAISTKGYKYGDKSQASDGVKKLILKGDTAGKSKILIQAKDGNVPLPTLPLDASGPVIAQLSSSDPNLPCYEETFPQANATKNEAEQFKAKTP